MRTASEVYEEVAKKAIASFSVPDKKSIIENAMRTYAKEAIEECAERAESVPVWGDIDKQSILSLINELK